MLTNSFRGRAIAAASAISAVTGGLLVTGVSADIYAGNPGAESWSNADSRLRNTRGTGIGHKPHRQRHGDPAVAGRALRRLTASR